MKIPMLLPRIRGSEYISAMIPVTMARGAEAKTPASRRKTRNVAQVGDNAQARVDRLNKAKVPTLRILRPYCSLRGPHRIGPIT